MYWKIVSVEPVPGADPVPENAQRIVKWLREGKRVFSL